MGEGYPSKCTLTSKSRLEAAVAWIVTSSSEAIHDLVNAVTACSLACAVNFVLT